MQPLRVNIFNTSSNLPLLAAQEAGFFSRRGLALEIQHTPNSDAQRGGLAEFGVCWISSARPRRAKQSASCAASRGRLLEVLKMF